jgi:succinate dehydrogenase / fumarate reductase membrane anchor subunit
VVLIFLVIVHLIIMHATNDVSCTTYQFVTARYANPLWRLFDWLLLTLALTHGMNGLRIVIDDYVRSHGLRLTLLSLAGTLLVVFFMLGTITLITFQPVAGNLGPACLPR